MAAEALVRRRFKLGHPMELAGIITFWAAVGLGLVGLGVALYAAKREGRASLDYVRIVMSILFLLASYVPFNHLLVLYLSGDPRLGDFRVDDFRFYVAFGLATLLGAFAVATLFVRRQAHFVAGVLFFGHWLGIMFVEIGSNALAGRVFRSVADTVVEYGFRAVVLALAVAGIVVESLCERRRGV